MMSVIGPCLHAVVVAFRLISLLAKAFLSLCWANYRLISWTFTVCQALLATLGHGCVLLLSAMSDCVNFLLRIIEDTSSAGEAVFKLAGKLIHLCTEAADLVLESMASCVHFALQRCVDIAQCLGLSVLLTCRVMKHLSMEARDWAIDFAYSIFETIQETTLNSYIWAEERATQLGLVIGGSVLCICELLRTAALSTVLAVLGLFSWLYGVGWWSLSRLWYCIALYGLTYLRTAFSLGFRSLLYVLGKLFFLLTSAIAAVPNELLISCGVSIAVMLVLKLLLQRLSNYNLTFPRLTFFTRGPNIHVNLLARDDVDDRPLRGVDAINRNDAATGNRFPRAFWNDQEEFVIDDSDTDEQNDVLVANRRAADIIDLTLPETGGQNVQSASASSEVNEPLTADKLYRLLESERDKRTCIVCQDRQKNVLLLPCRHMCLCAACATEIATAHYIARRVCPLCRTPIETVMSVFV